MKLGKKTYPNDVSEPPFFGCWEALSNGQSLYKYLTWKMSQKK